MQSFRTMRLLEMNRQAATRNNEEFSTMDVSRLMVREKCRWRMRWRMRWEIERKKKLDDVYVTFGRHRHYRRTRGGLCRHHHPRHSDQFQVKLYEMPHCTWRLRSTMVITMYCHLTCARMLQHQDE